MNDDLTPSYENTTSNLYNNETIWNVYKRQNEARKLDKEKNCSGPRDWKKTLDSILIFAALFAAALTAFIMESKLLVLSMNIETSKTSTSYLRADFDSKSTEMSIYCLLFGSLGVSLVAALSSVTAIQWVMPYDDRITCNRSSHRDKARFYYFAGVENWLRGKTVEVLRLLLYFSMALSFLGVIQWMLYLHMITAYIVGGAAIATLFCFFSTLLEAIPVSTPFKTLVSGWVYSTYNFTFTFIPRVSVSVISSWQTSKIMAALRLMVYSSVIRCCMGIRVCILCLHNKLVSVFCKNAAFSWLSHMYSIPASLHEMYNHVTAVWLEKWRHNGLREIQFGDPAFEDGPGHQVLTWLAPHHQPPHIKKWEQHSSEAIQHKKPVGDGEVKDFRRLWDTGGIRYIRTDKIGPFLVRIARAFDSGSCPFYCQLKALYRYPRPFPSNPLVLDPGLYPLDHSKLRDKVLKLNWNEVRKWREVRDHIYWETPLLGRRKRGKVSFLWGLRLFLCNKLFGKDEVDEIDDFTHGGALAEQHMGTMATDMPREELWTAYRRRRFRRPRMWRERPRRQHNANIRDTVIRWGLKLKDRTRIADVANMY